MQIALNIVVQKLILLISTRTIIIFVLKARKKLSNLRKKITVNTVIVTDFAGHPAKWREINKLKKKYKFF